MKLEPDMGRMRNTVATETQTRLPMDTQKVVTSVYYMFYNHSQNGGESLLSYPYAIRQTKMGYKTQKHGDNNNSE